MAELRQITPLLDLAKILGKIGAQLIESPIKSISIKCYGNIEDSKPISLSYLIGLLQDITDTRLNFINAAIIAEERGISFSHSMDTEIISFSNMIQVSLTTQNGEVQLGGSVFGDKHFRIINVQGYGLDFRPEGNMIFVQNRDVPGVIGKVGTLLSKADVNIGEYLLGRTDNNEMAYLVIKVDGQVSSDLLEELIMSSFIFSGNSSNELGAASKPSDELSLLVDCSCLLRFSIF